MYGLVKFFSDRAYAFQKNEENAKQDQHQQHDIKEFSCPDIRAENNDQKLRFLIVAIYDDTIYL